MKPGDVVIADVPGVVQSKKRPAVVISSAFYHSDRPDLILAIISSRVVKATSTTDHILEDWELAGLIKPSFVRMFLYSIAAEKVIRIGSISPRDWQKVQENVKRSLEI